MARQAFDLIHESFNTLDIDIEGMTLQELFDHRFIDIQLCEKMVKKFEELNRKKPG